MAETSIIYGTPAALTITLDGLESSDGILARRSVPITNTLGWEDFAFFITLALGAGDLVASPQAAVYYYSSLDGTTWETGGSTDALVTLGGNEHLLTSVNMLGGPMRFVMSSGFKSGFIPPKYWGLLVTQCSGQALGTGCSISYCGMRHQTV